jgi:cell division protease FtsH
VMLFGGRVAEEMIFGAEKVTTGAGNDIERATSMARRMVTQFGMSEAIGPMAIGDSETEVFLGRDIGQRRQVSEQTARLVDGEVKRILDEAYEVAERILTDNQDLLERMAQALLERETLDREQVELRADGKALPPSRTRPPTPPVEPVTVITPQSGPATGPGLGDLSPSVARGRTSGA